MGPLLEKLEGLFVVKRKETTYKKGLFALVLVLIAGFSLPIYFKYEDYAYGKYKEEYDYVVGEIEMYRDENNNYPLGDPINWNNEKDLKKFFVENKFSTNRELYYIDEYVISELKDKKHTYIIDPQNETVYTSEFIVFHYRRWHFAFY